MGAQVKKMKFLIKTKQEATVEHIPKGLFGNSRFRNGNVFTSLFFSPFMGRMGMGY